MGNFIVHKPTPVGIKPYLNIHREAFDLIGGDENMHKIIDFNLCHKWNNIVSENLYFIINKVFEETMETIHGKGKSKNARTARTIIIFLYYRYSLANLKTTGKKFRMHHSTILYHDKILGDKELKRYDNDMYVKLEEVRELFVDRMKKYVEPDDYLVKYRHKIKLLFNNYIIMKKNKGKSFIEIVSKMN